MLALHAFCLPAPCWTERAAPYAHLLCHYSRHFATRICLVSTIPLFYYSHASVFLVAWFSSAFDTQATAASTRHWTGAGRRAWDGWVARGGLNEHRFVLPPFPPQHGYCYSTTPAFTYILNSPGPPTELRARRPALCAHQRRRARLASYLFSPDWSLLPIREPETNRGERRGEL